MNNQNETIKQRDEAYHLAQIAPYQQTHFEQSRPKKNILQDILDQDTNSVSNRSSTNIMNIQHNVPVKLVIAAKCKVKYNYKGEFQEILEVTDFDIDEVLEVPEEEPTND